MSNLTPAPDWLDSIIDISHFRVAGIGGLGLVVIAGLVAREYPLIGVVLTIGAVGGVLLGAVGILYRRRHRAPASAS